MISEDKEIYQYKGMRGREGVNILKEGFFFQGGKGWGGGGVYV